MTRKNCYNQAGQTLLFPHANWWMTEVTPPKKTPVHSAPQFLNNQDFLAPTHSALPLTTSLSMGIIK